MNQLLPVKALFRQSFDLYYKKFTLFGSIQLVNVPFLIVASLYGELYTRESFQQAIGSGSWSAGSFGILFFLVAIVGAVVALWSQAALVFAMKERESTLEAKHFLAVAGQHWKSFAWVYFLTAIITGAGFLALIVPGIIFAVWFSFSVYIFVAEGLRGRAALRQSRTLVEGQWWSIFARLLAVALFMFLVAIATGWMRVAGDIVSIFFAMPFGVIYGYLLYEDIKKSKAVAV